MRHHESYNVGNTGLGMKGDCISAIFARDNERFDPERFEAAAWGEENA